MTACRNTEHSYRADDFALQVQTKGGREYLAAPVIRSRRLREFLLRWAFEVASLSPCISSTSKAIEA